MMRRAVWRRQALMRAGRYSRSVSTTLPLGLGKREEHLPSHNTGGAQAAGRTLSVMQM